MLDNMFRLRYNQVAIWQQGGEKMINAAKIRGRIVEKGTTLQSLSRELDISAYTLGRKISGKSKMTLEEAEKLQRLLAIPDGEFEKYFFLQLSCNFATRS